MEVESPSPARDLVRVHHAITRGLNIDLEKAKEYSLAGFPDAWTQQGFCDFSNSLLKILEAHHLTEDVVIFPTLMSKLPLAPYEHLALVHKQIADLLVLLNQSVEKMSQNEYQEGLRGLMDGLEQVAQLWPPHIRMEESIFSHEALSEVMTPSEQGQLSAAAGKFSSENSTPGYLTIPFMLFNMQPEERAAFTNNMPPNFFNDMVMGAWKDQWEPMRPFLLD